MYDLALSDHGDLIMAGSRDLAGVSGVDLINQRIVIRLTVHRGSWLFDTDGTFGSFLYLALGQAPQSALQIDSYVREALKPMTEISIEDVVSEFREDLNSLVIQVQYSMNPGTDSEITLSGGDVQQTTVTVPYVLGGQ